MTRESEFSRTEGPVSKEKEESNNIWVQIMGVPASGKTTLCKYIGGNLDFEVIEELPVEDNPLFEKYYKDPDTWSLPIQMFFLYEKYYGIMGEREGGIKGRLKRANVVSEPPIWQDAIYAKARLGEDPDRKDKYDRFYEGMVRQSSFPLPDLIVYLRVSFPNMLRMIKERAERDSSREVELKEKKSYWKRLWELNEEWVNENPLGLTIVTVERDSFDSSKFANIDAALKSMVESINIQTSISLGS